MAAPGAQNLAPVQVGKYEVRLADYNAMTKYSTFQKLYSEGWRFVAREASGSAIFEREIQ